MYVGRDSAPTFTALYCIITWALAFAGCYAAISVTDYAVLQAAEGQFRVSPFFTIPVALAAAWAFLSVRGLWIRLDNCELTSVLQMSAVAIAMIRRIVCPWWFGFFIYQVSQVESAPSEAFTTPLLVIALWFALTVAFELNKSLVSWIESDVVDDPIPSLWDLRSRLEGGR